MFYESVGGILLKKLWKKCFITAILTLLSVAIMIPQGNVYADGGISIEAKSAIMVDAKTGRILVAQDIDTVSGIASMTKMMTEYLLLEAVKEKKVTWDQEYAVSEYAYKVSQKRNLSNVPLRKDGKYTIKELYEAMAIYSANGASVSIAEAVAGTEENFVKMMNDKAAQMGIKDFKFVNSTGLNNKDLQGYHPKTSGTNDENVMTAKGVATLAYNLLHDFPEVTDTSKIPKKVFREKTKDKIKMDNWNWMLPTLIYGYEGVDGLKTGHTDFAGYCFASTAERNGMRLITVVLDAKLKGKPSYKARFDATKKLLDYGFANYTTEELFKAGYQVDKNKTVPVTKGKEDNVTIATKSPISMVIKRGDKGKYKPVYTADKTKLDKDGNLTAPVKKGDVVGSLAVQYDGGSDGGFLTAEGQNLVKVDVITSGDVEKAGTFSLIMRSIGGFFSDVWNGAADTVKGWFS